MKINVCIFGVAFAVAVLAAGAAPAVTYDFAKIADSSGSFAIFQYMTPTGVRTGPAVNNQGLVAFQAMLDNQSKGVYTAKGPNSITTIATAPMGPDILGQPSLNDYGVAAFYRFNSMTTTHSIVKGSSSSTLGVVAQAGNPLYFKGLGAFASINNNDQVAFFAYTASYLGIYRASSPTDCAAVATDETEPSVSNFGKAPAINNSGKVVFYANDWTGTETVHGIFDGPSRQNDVIVDTTGILDNFALMSGTPTVSINDAGTVMFFAQRDDGATGIYTATGPSDLTTIADTTGPYYGFDDQSNCGINNYGQMAFQASLDAGGAGIFIAPAAVPTKVVQWGDSLFGSTVTDTMIGPDGLNDKGQIAFVYQLASGELGIALATPTAVSVSAGAGQLAIVGGGTAAVGGVEATFQQTDGGTFAGSFSLESSPLDPALNISFAIPSDPLQLWNLTFDGALDGPVTLVLTYDDQSLLPGVSEAELLVYHQLADGSWQPLPVLARDLAANTIAVTTTSFSNFALAIPEPGSFFMALAAVLAGLLWRRSHRRSGARA